MALPLAKECTKRTHFEYYGDLYIMLSSYFMPNSSTLDEKLYSIWFPADQKYWFAFVIIRKYCYLSGPVGAPRNVCYAHSRY